MQCFSPADMNGAELVKEIRTVLKVVKIRQKQLALELGITQGRVSQIPTRN